MTPTQFAFRKQIIGICNRLSIGDIAEIEGGTLEVDVRKGKRGYWFTDRIGRVSYFAGRKEATWARDRLIDYVLAGLEESEQVA